MKSAVRSVAALAGLVVAPFAPAQPPARFPTKVELVTVDVVVVDADGQPVPGLTRDDFVVEEDGRMQPIVSFEAVQAEAQSSGLTPEPRVATNETERPRARAFAIVLDDLSMEPSDVVQARRALASFLDRSVRDGDEVTLATTSADAWWSARMPEGHADLLAVAERLRSKTSNSSNAADYMSEYEAFWIDEHGDLSAAPVIARVVARWTNNRICFERDPACPALVKGRARAIEMQRAPRTRAALETVRRALLSLGTVRGRKSLLLFSRGFIDDGSPQTRKVVAVSRETNTAVFFVDTRGLIGMSEDSGSAASAGAPDVREQGRTSFESRNLAAAGAMSLADETGGFSVRNTNDLAGGAERVAAESRVFYMVGFEAPPGKKPGEWRKLVVRMKREGLKARARRGYTLRAEGGGPPPRSIPAKEGTRALPPAVENALDTAHEVSGIPLRVVTYVLEPRGKDTTHVLIAAEVDASVLTFQGAGKSRAARLEVTAAATLRDTGQTYHTDERVEIRAPDGEPAGWRSIAREFDLPAGVAQARLIVRDPVGEAMGAVTQRFEVPPAGALRVSTPIVSDQVVKPAGAGGKPRAAVAAHRTFASGGGLYCEFEVFGSARDPSDGVPRVSSGFEVRAGDGTVVRRAAPTRIAPDPDGRIVRLFGLDLAGLPEGAYEMVLEVRDEAGGGQLERREPFTIG